MGFGKALCYGAVTIINAIATGKGAAFGVDLWTKAEVTLTEEPGIIDGVILSDTKENPRLIANTVRRTLDHLKLADKCGAKVKTWSNIPIARGLKSSSSAANSIVLATAAASNRQLNDLDVVNLGVDGAIDANVTITGAFDDACASYFGGIVVTDNIQKKITQKSLFPENLSALLLVPSNKSYTNNLDKQRINCVKPLVEKAYKELCDGDFWTALTLNGLIYSSILGYNPSIAMDALQAGAIAAGVSGTGPTVVAITQEDRIDSIIDIWESYEGEIICASPNHEKARAMD